MTWLIDDSANKDLCCCQPPCLPWVAKVDPEPALVIWQRLEILSFCRSYLHRVNTRFGHHFGVKFIREVTTNCRVDGQQKGSKKSCKEVTICNFTEAVKGGILLLVGLCLGGLGDAQLIDVTPLLAGPVNQFFPRNKTQHGFRSMRKNKLERMSHKQRRTIKSSRALDLSIARGVLDCSDCLCSDDHSRFKPTLNI